MELLEAHGRAMAGFDRVVGKISDTDWPAPTPCSEWTVRDLLNHLVYEQLWVPQLLGGATVEEVGDRFDGDVLDGDPVGRWRTASTAARSAWLAPGAVDREVSLSSRRAPATTYGWEMTLDLGVHGWDLAVGIGADSPLDAELADTLLDVFEDVVPDVAGLRHLRSPAAGARGRRLPHPAARPVRPARLGARLTGGARLVCPSGLAGRAAVSGWLGFKKAGDEVGAWVGLVGAAWQVGGPEAI